MKPRNYNMVPPAEIQRLSKSNVTFFPLFFPTDDAGYTIWYHIVISRCTQPPTCANSRSRTSIRVKRYSRCVRWIQKGGGSGRLVY